MIKETGGPAFPVECDWSDEEPRGIQTGNHQGWASGLTIRDYFAAKALQGLLAGYLANDTSITPKDDCETAYKFADAMIKERSQS